MINEESPDPGRPVESTAAPRPLTAAETLARALGTAPRSDPPAPAEELADGAIEHEIAAE
jgi:hypothetical protein